MPTLMIGRSGRVDLRVRVRSVAPSENTGVTGGNSRSADDSGADADDSRRAPLVPWATR